MIDSLLQDYNNFPFLSPFLSEQTSKNFAGDVYKEKFLHVYGDFLLGLLPHFLLSIKKVINCLCCQVTSLMRNEPEQNIG